MQQTSYLPPPPRTHHRLIDIGLILVAVPVPHVKVLGIVAIGAGLGFELHAELQRRKVG